MDENPKKIFTYKAITIPVIWGAGGYAPRI